MSVMGGKREIGRSQACLGQVVVGKVGKVFWDSGFLGAGLSQMKGEWEGLSAEEERREAPSEGVCVCGGR